MAPNCFFPRCPPQDPGLVKYGDETTPLWFPPPIVPRNGSAQLASNRTRPGGQPY